MPRNTETNQRMKQERRDKILNGALELFARGGLAGTKISDIAAQTRMSNGLVYHYFPSKDDIYTELVRYAFERLIAACSWLEAARLEPDEKIRFALDELVKNLRSKPDNCLYHLLIAQAATSWNIPQEAKRIIERNRREPYEVISRIILEGQKKSVIRQGNPEELAFFFWNTINGLAIHQAMYGDTAQSPGLEPVYHMFFNAEGAENA
jgi:AcrR family transcriptional regulator